MSMIDDMKTVYGPTVDPRQIAACEAEIARLKSLEPLEYVVADDSKVDGRAWRHSGGMVVIASAAIEHDGNAWLHVSYSHRMHMPAYREGRQVKALFIGGDREAYSVWATEGKHVNQHQYCLHLWARADGSRALPDFTQGTGGI